MSTTYTKILQQIYYILQYQFLLWVITTTYSLHENTYFITIQYDPTYNLLLKLTKKREDSR